MYKRAFPRRWEMKRVFERWGRNDYAYDGADDYWEDDDTVSVSSRGAPRSFGRDPPQQGEPRDTSTQQRADAPADTEDAYIEAPPCALLPDISKEEAVQALNSHAASGDAYWPIVDVLNIPFVNKVRALTNLDDSRFRSKHIPTCSEPNLEHVMSMMQIPMWVSGAAQLSMQPALMEGFDSVRKSVMRACPELADKLREPVQPTYEPPENGAANVESGGPSKAPGTTFFGNPPSGSKGAKNNSNACDNNIPYGITLQTLFTYGGFDFECILEVINFMKDETPDAAAADAAKAAAAGKLAAAEADSEAKHEAKRRTAEAAEAANERVKSYPHDSDASAEAITAVADAKAAADAAYAAAKAVAEAKKPPSTFTRLGDALGWRIANTESSRTNWAKWFFYRLLDAASKNDSNDRTWKYDPMIKWLYHRNDAIPVGDSSDHRSSMVDDAIGTAAENPTRTASYSGDPSNAEFIENQNMRARFVHKITMHMRVAIDKAGGSYARIMIERARKQKITVDTLQQDEFIVRPRAQFTY